MKYASWRFCGLFIVGFAPPCSARDELVFEATSPYHHIRVVDQQGIRTLFFDNFRETRMALTNHLLGHFEYTEYFHLAWLWSKPMTNVLMIGLGGASVQRSFQHYYPEVTVETVELDPLVVKVARDYFKLKDTPRSQVYNEDGRVYLRRSAAKYNAIFMDAYTASRYGSYIPAHLVTREFFQLASEHLTDDGVLAYNIAGTFRGWQANLLGAVFKTMKAVFPHVYQFPANDSLNVVLIGTKGKQPVTLAALQQRANELIKQGRVTLPTFQRRVLAFRAAPPLAGGSAPLLTDDYAPVEGLLRGDK